MRDVKDSSNRRELVPRSPPRSKGRQPDHRSMRRVWRYGHLQRTQPNHLLHRKSVTSRPDASPVGEPARVHSSSRLPDPPPVAVHAADEAPRRGGANCLRASALHGGEHPPTARSPTRYGDLRAGDLLRRRAGDLWMPPRLPASKSSTSMSGTSKLKLSSPSCVSGRLPSVPFPPEVTATKWVENAYGGSLAGHSERGGDRQQHVRTGLPT